MTLFFRKLVYQLQLKNAMEREKNLKGGGKMRKFLVVMGAIVMFCSLEVFAIPVGIPFEAKFNNYEVLNVSLFANPPSTFPTTWRNLADDIEDNWGIAYVTTIWDISTVPHTQIWPPAGSTEEFTAIFYGLDIDEIIWYSSTNVEVHMKPLSSGAYLDIYFQDPGNFTLGNASDRSGTSYPTVTDGTLFFRAQFNPGILPGNFTHIVSVNHNLATNQGSGKGFLDVIPGVGTSWSLFDSNTIVDNNGNYHDFSMQFNFNASAYQSLGWTLDSYDPIRGFTTPEPNTILFLGIGLLGLGMIKRKRRS